MPANAVELSQQTTLSWVPKELQGFPKHRSRLADENGANNFFVTNRALAILTSRRLRCIRLLNLIVHDRQGVRQ
jgi:hypothetical protein